jgi:hypothetical protein
MTHVNLIWQPPVRVVSTLGSTPKEKDGSYLACTGLKTFYKNCYTFIHPVNSQITLTPGETEYDSPSDGVSEGFPAWTFETQPIKGQYRVTFDFGWTFFSEEPLQMLVTPPYMHNTSDKEGGFIAAGSYDISKWFRPINTTYVLWPKSKSIKITKGDPALYIHFLTDRPINLIQYEMTDEIYEIVCQTVALKKFMPMRPLNVLYEMFTKGSRDKQLLRRIKENLLTNV